MDTTFCRSRTTIPQPTGMFVSCRFDTIRPAGSRPVSAEPDERSWRLKMTTLTRYRSPLARLWPVSDIDELRRQARRLFEDVEVPVTMDNFTFAPALDVIENDKEILVTAELPGLKSEDVTVEVDNNVLIVKGEKKSEFEKKDTQYHIWERSYGTFQRMIPLPRTVKADAIEAKIENGVLSIVLPKADEAVGRKIPITTK
jgi:HSP20 family protein